MLSHVLSATVFNTTFCTLQEKFKSGLLHSAEEFKKTITNLVDDFDSNGPFSADVTVDKALEFIAGLKEQLANLKEKEDSIRRGLNMFKIDQPPSNMIESLEKVQ